MPPSADEGESDDEDGLVDRQRFKRQPSEDHLEK